MIIYDSTPDKWTSIYEPINYKFTDRTSLGNYNVAINVGLNVSQISAGGGIGLFSVNDIVAADIGGVLYVGVVESIVGPIARLDRNLGVSGLSRPIYKLDNTNKTIDLFVGKIAAGIPLTKLVSLISTPKEGVHNVDVAGYLQDYFENIQRPPVLGVDKELFCNYRLGATDLRYGLYSTQPDVNLLAPGSALRVNALEIFAGQGSLFTRLMANSTQNFNL